MRGRECLFLCPAPDFLLRLKTNVGNSVTHLLTRRSGEAGADAGLLYTCCCSPIHAYLLASLSITELLAQCVISSLSFPIGRLTAVRFCFTQTGCSSAHADMGEKMSLNFVGNF